MSFASETGPSESEAASLGERYHEIMAFRAEAFNKYRAHAVTTIAGPPTLFRFPKVSTDTDYGIKSKRIGPLIVRDNPPCVSLVERFIRERQRPCRILEIGPGQGDLARQLLARYTESIDTYFAVDRDKSVVGPWQLLDCIEDAPNDLDLVIASEVIEHLSVDNFFSTMLLPAQRKLRRDGAFISTTPNPTAPGGVNRDFTHVQRYPWYDLYAVFRLAFQDVEVRRTCYVYDPVRILKLIPKALICFALELEWCEGLACVASNPRRL